MAYMEIDIQRLISAAPIWGDYWKVWSCGVYQPPELGAGDSSEAEVTDVTSPGEVPKS